MERTIQQYMKKVTDKMRHTTPDGTIWLRAATGLWVSFGGGKTETDEGLARHHINSIPTVK
jgi:hypothetical protein